MFFFVFLCLLSYFWVFLGGLSYLLHAMTRRQTEPESSAPLESKDSSAYRASIVLTCAVPVMISVLVSQAFPFTAARHTAAFMFRCSDN